MIDLSHIMLYMTIYSDMFIGIRLVGITSQLLWGGDS